MRRWSTGCALLIGLLGCGDSPGPDGVGSIDVHTVTAGEPADLNGYQVTVDGHVVATVPPTSDVSIPSQPAGDRSVRLTDVAENCAVQGDNPKLVTVTADAAVSVAFGVLCGPGIGSARVQVVTTGADLDPDGYLIVASGVEAPVPSNGEVVLAGLPAGQATVQLFGIAANCTLVGPGQQEVEVPLSGEVAVQFEAACRGPERFDLVFQAQLGSVEGPDLYRVNASGAHLRNLTTSDAWETFPSWSHDGTRIVFNRSLTLAPGNLFVMGSDGTNPGDLGVAAFQADWSPDDVRLAAVVDRNIVLLDSDGTGLSQLTGVTCEIFVDGCSRFSAPHWSPDGARILYYAGGGLFAGKGCDVIDIDGTGTVRLNASCVNPTWSPDGTRIAYEFNGHIMAMDADGGNVVDLSLVSDPFTANPASNERLASWSPDGVQIAFVSNRYIEDEVNVSGLPHVFVMNADGTDVRHVTIGSDFFDVGRPTWGPAPP